MNIKLLLDHIAVERIEEKPAGGIIILEDSREKSIQGVIVAAGSGARDASGNRIPMDVKVGDTVLFQRWGGTEFKLGGKELTIMRESDVIAILGE